MATKKYLSLDEASAELGLSADQIVKLREDGRLRGFADRGTWKFKADDIAEYARSRQADSAPDVPIIDDDDSFLAGAEGDRLSSSSILGSSSIMTGDITGDDGDPPTVIRSDASGSAIFDDEPLLSSSDSDVRLYHDRDYSKTDSSPDVALHKESDSDVRLVDDQVTGKAGRGSDSDVQLSGYDENFDTVSDVRLLSDDDVSVTSGSDSDVALVKSGDSGTSGGSALGDSVFDDEDGITLAGDSGIALESIADSGIALDSGPASHGRPGSAIGPDSGIGLADSGIIGAGSALHGSSIVSLSEDSGIALEALNDDSAVGGSGARRGGGHHDPTEHEMNASSFDDSEFELASVDDLASGDDTSVILFDDDDSFDVVSAKSGAASGFSGSAVNMGDDFDEFEEAGSSVVMEDDDMEFEAADDDFDDGFQTGESAAEFAAPVQRVVVAPEPEIGALTFVGLTASSIMLAICGMMMFDLVRSMWGYHDPTVSSWLLENTRSLF